MSWALLAFRRTLAPLLVLLCAAGFAVIARTHWSSTEGERGALERQAVWLCACFGVVPLLVVRAARNAGRWVGAESDWVRPRPAARWKTSTTAFVGTWLAAGVLLGLGAVAAELAAGEHVPTARVVRAPSIERALLLPGEAVTRPLTLDGEASALRIHLVTLPGAGGPATRVHVSARRVGTAGEPVVALGFSRFHVDVPVPSGDGELELVVVHGGAGPPVGLLEHGIQGLADDPSRWGSAFDTWLHVWVAVGVWLGLAQGLGSWLSAGIATLLVGTLWLPLFAGGASTWPGTELGVVLAGCGAGLGPAPLVPAQGLAAVALAALGVALSAAALATPRVPR